MLHARRNITYLIFCLFIALFSCMPSVHAKAKTSLNNTSKTLTNGSSFTLKVQHAKNAYQASCKSKIVSVKKKAKNSWQITANKTGTTTIVVSSGKKKFKCKVTVKNAKISKKATKFYAHRGYANKYPENSYIAQKMALKAGFYGTNCDVWPTKKDKKGNFEFAVSHDNSLYRMTGKHVKISRLTASQVVKYRITKGKNAKKHKNQHVMLLKNLLKLTKSHKKHIQIEMKGHWNDKQIAKLAKQLKSYGFSGKVTVESLNVGNLRTFKRKAKQHHLKAGTNLIATSNALSKAKQCKKYGFTNVVAHYRLINDSLVTYCRKNKVGCAAYIPVGQHSKRIVSKLMKYKLKSIGTPDIPW